MSRLSRKLAESLLDHAARVMPPAHRGWVRAMRVELEHVPGPLAASAFALGCVRASYAQRIADMLTIARLTRWTLAGLALASAGFGVLAATLLIAIKASPDIKPADLGSDAGTAETLAFIQAYPAWEVGLIGLIAALTAGAVQLARRGALALPLLVLGVGLATLRAIIDLRLPDPGADRPLDSVASLLIPLLCLAPVWWLSRRAPDLKATS
jgi:hypothetical protein